MNRNVIILSTLLLTAGITYAKSHVMDSLLNVLKTAKQDTDKVKTLNLLSGKLWKTSRYDTALICADSAQVLAEKLNFKLGMAAAYRNIAIINRYKGNYPLAIEYNNKALKINQELGDKRGIAANLGNLGNVYDEQGDFPKALKYDLDALAILEELGNKEGMALNFANIGNVYADMGNYNKALEYSMKALKLDEELHRTIGIATNLINIGLNYFSLRDYPKALESYGKALVIENELEDKEGIGVIMGNTGNVYFLEGKYPLALEYSIKALEIGREIGNTEGIIRNLNNIGLIYIKQKELKLSKFYFDSALQLAISIGDKSIIQTVYNGLCEYDSAAGDSKSGLADFKKYVQYGDSLGNETATKKTVQAEMNFEFEQKQSAEKAEQDKKDAIAEQERKKQNVIRNSFIAGFALMLALAFFILRGYRQKQKANEIIKLQKAVVEEKQKEILDSIHYAQRIQHALLASDATLNKNLPEHFLLFKPKDIVSGDFYWATTKENRFYLAVCDSTGHGVPGAFMSLLNISFLNEAITEKGIAEPSKILNHARKKLIENISYDGGQDGMDGTLLCFSGSGLSYASAYNTAIVIRKGEAIELNADKMPIGTSPKENESFTLNLFPLQKGDMLYVFTDGYADQFGGVKGKKYKYKQLEEKLLAINQQPTDEQKNILNKEFEDWRGNLEQVDDVLIIGIRV
ncbi:MAG TPA: tetratricopeptide repeat protein [Bacteroidia bacterium]|jgi:serine phosphatase RsbU (regulator of sigma subunit)|nr:tetratricopeptide repeat protein [Bacteroidia bacterium]